jgi:electron transfer flavoprotein alpha subunit
MSDFIVLLKQVPDVSRITDNVFHPQTGTLMRNKLESVINELDAQALSLAARMRALSGGGRLVALTMGPPQAEEVLRYALCREADEAFLLTDRLLGGADTYATANPLACAIRRIARERFNGSQDYWVVSGMQSVDGDTAQVPAQIAEELGIPCLAYATDVELKNGRLALRRIVSGGAQTAAPRRLPCVVTVAKYEAPLPASFAASRRGLKIPVTVWGAAQIEPAAFGAAGSKTRVVRVFPPAKSTRLCKRLPDARSLALALRETFRASAGEAAAASVAQAYRLPSLRNAPWERPFEMTDKDNADWSLLAKALADRGPAGLDEAARMRLAAESGGRLDQKALEEMLLAIAHREPAYKGDVWVAVEHSDGEPVAATYELLGKARELADGLGVKVGALAAGKDVAGMADALISAGADEVHVVEHPALEPFDPAVFRKAFCAVIEQHWPQILLFAATPQGRVLAPMVSYRLGCGLTADCTGLEVRDQSRRRELAILAQTRPALGGNVMATICTSGSRCQMATARPGVMKRLPADPSRRGIIVRHPVGLSVDDQSLEILSSETSHGRVDFSSADIIVSGGRGLRSREDYEGLVSSLAKNLAKSLGAKVERGASRAAVEQGFAERARQVGQTGTAVGPRLYLALGISGAIQHMIGVANSGKIFAVNVDPHASILHACDYYLVARAEEAVPDIVKALEEDLV